ncbi:MAG: arginine repressor [Clostridia bacterium]|nr:arginine repressor [Clostridia bacterium]MDD4276062.1 arginine repressor [Clostridia bacterium]
MARTSRQSKILEIINQKEIETQDELVAELRAENYDVTQATISRDIKELGLIKIMADSKRYKYALVESTEQVVSNKLVNIFKECVISIKSARNLIVIKTLRGMAFAASNLIDKLSINEVLGSVASDDTIMVVASDDKFVTEILRKISEATE